MKIFKLIFIIFFLFHFLILSAEDDIRYVDSLKNITETSQNAVDVCQAHIQLCWIQRGRDPEMAMQSGLTALKIIEQYPGLDTLKPEIYNYLGLISRNKGEYNVAINYYIDALALAQKHNIIKQLAYSHNNLGGIFTLKGDYDNSIKHLEEAMHYFNQNNDIEGMGYVAINLGNLNRHFQNLQVAIEYFDEAIKYKEQLNDSVGVATALNLKAISYFSLKDYNKAEQIYNDLQIRYTKNKDIKGLASVNNYLGNIELVKKKYGQALEYFVESYKLNSQIQNKQGQALALIYMGLSNHYLANRKEADDKMLEGYTIAKEIGDNEVLLHTHKNYSTIYSDRGDYKKAWEHQKEYADYVIKKNQYETQERIATLHINNELEKQQATNQKLNQKVSQTTESLKEVIGNSFKYQFIIVTLLILLIIMGLVIYRLNRKTKIRNDDNAELLNSNQMLIEANQTRERFLSIIGHDLKNPFNSVLGLSSLLVDEWESINNDEKRIIINEINITGHALYELMDNLLIWAKNQSHSLQYSPSPFNINENIIDTYELFRNQATFKEIHIALNIGTSNIVFADPNMINTIIRNLMSNAIKFTRKGGRIQVDIKSGTNEMEFCISDNGKGILPEDLKRIIDQKENVTTKGTANETGTGLGLLLVKDFVIQNKGVFWVDTKVGVGSKFCFTLPYRP